VLETAGVHGVLGLHGLEGLEVLGAEERQGEAAVAAALCGPAAVFALADQHLACHLGSVRRKDVAVQGYVWSIVLS